MSVRRRRLSLVKLSAGRLSHTPSKCLHANCDCDSLYVFVIINLQIMLVVD